MATAARFIWYELMTPDPDGAKGFYDAVVGWSLQPGSAESGDYGFIVRSDGGMNGGILRLTDDMAAHGARPCWLGYIQVPGVDAAVTAIEAAGGTLLMPARDVPMAGRIAMLTDPQGAAFYIMTPTPPPGQPDAKSDVFSVTDAQHFRWNELETSDPDAAIAFYRAQFGWGQEGAMEMGAMGSYRFIQADDVGIGAVMAMMDTTPHPVWAHYIGVDDIDRAAKAVQDHGGTVLHGPAQVPGDEYVLNGIDPQGASFALVGPRV